MAGPNYRYMRYTPVAPGVLPQDVLNLRDPMMANQGLLAQSAPSQYGGLTQQQRMDMFSSGGTEAGAGTGGGGMSALASAGLILGIAGALNSAIGSFYAAKTQKYQLKSQKLAAEFQRSMSALNARNAEVQAQNIMEAGQRQIGQYTMRAGQQKGAARASLAARGVQAGVGSAAEVMATGDVVTEIDVLTINSNTVRQAAAARMQGVNYMNEAAMAGLTAQNLGVTAGTIKPVGIAASSLLGSAGQVAGQWAVARQYGGYYPSNLG